MEFNLPLAENKKLEQVLERIRTNEKLEICLKMNNVTAIERLGYNDHGPTHVKIISNIALKILRVFMQAGLVPNIVKNYGLSREDAEIIVVMGAVLHDIGHTVHRVNHEMFSTIVAKDIIEEILDGIYPPSKLEIMKWEIIHCLVCHEAVTPLTLEAGVVKVADALDMEKGRARIPYEAGKIDIHSMSAMAIEEVEVQETGHKDKPIRIVITMANPAGIFQVDELLRQKIETSGILEYFEVEAMIMENGQKRTFKSY